VGYWPDSACNDGLEAIGGDGLCFPAAACICCGVHLSPAAGPASPLCVRGSKWAECIASSPFKHDMQQPVWVWWLRAAVAGRYAALRCVSLVLAHVSSCAALAHVPGRLPCVHHVRA
jgi:hypothetical protein